MPSTYVYISNKERRVFCSQQAYDEYQKEGGFLEFSKNIEQLGNEVCFIVHSDSKIVFIKNEKTAVFQTYMKAQSSIAKEIIFTEKKDFLILEYLRKLNYNCYLCEDTDWNGKYLHVIIKSEGVIDECSLILTNGMQEYYNELTENDTFENGTIFPWYVNIEGIVFRIKLTLIEL